MMTLSQGFTLRVCLFLEGHILGHFNPVLCREGGSGGLRPQSLCSILSLHSHQTFPTLLIHLRYLDLAQAMARRERADPQSGQ
jgi:hypothetical protein